MHIQVTPTLNWILNNVYNLERPQTRVSTFKKLKTHVSKWEKFGGNVPADQVTRATLLSFRKAAIDAGYSPSTVNSWMRTATDLIRLAGYSLESKRLKLSERDSPKPTPTLDELCAAWRAAQQAVWPRRKPVNGRPVWCSIGPTVWCRAVMVFGFSLGLRRADLFNLKWSDIQPTRIPTVNRKTGKTQYLPIPDELHKWFPVLRRLNSDKIFGVNDRQKQIDTEFNSLGRLAGISDFGCQALRRAAANAYERAHAGAGAIILNHGKTVTTSSYIDPEEILREAAKKLVYPESFKHGPSLDYQRSLF